MTILSFAEPGFLGPGKKNKKNSAFGGGVFFFPHQKKHGDFDLAGATIWRKDTCKKWLEMVDLMKRHTFFAHFLQIHEDSGLFNKFGKGLSCEKQHIL